MVIFASSRGMIAAFVVASTHLHCYIILFPLFIPFTSFSFVAHVHVQCHIRIHVHVACCMYECTRGFRCDVRTIWQVVVQSPRARSVAVVNLFIPSCSHWPRHKNKIMKRGEGMKRVVIKSLEGKKGGD